MSQLRRPYSGHLLLLLALLVAMCPGLLRPSAVSAEPSRPVWIYGYVCSEYLTDWDQMYEECPSTTALDFTVSQPDATISYDTRQSAEGDTKYMTVIDGLETGVTAFTPIWSDVTTHPQVSIGCFENVHHWFYGMTLNPGESLSMSLETTHHWTCAAYLMPPFGTTKPDLPDLSATITAPNFLSAALQIAVTYCEEAWDDIRNAWEECDDDAVNTSASASSEFGVSSQFGLPQSQTAIGKHLYAFDGLARGAVTITPSYTLPSSGTLIYCTDAASDDQGALTKVVPIGESFTLTAASNSRFMCDAYVLPDVPVEPTKTPDEVVTLDIDVFYCDLPVDDLDLARQECMDDVMYSAVDAQTAISVSGAEGGPFYTDPLQGTTYRAYGDCCGMIAITPDFPGRTNVQQTLTSCLDVGLGSTEPVTGAIAPGESFSVDSVPGSDYTCEFYVIPTADPDPDGGLDRRTLDETPEPTDDTEDTGAIGIYARGCPEGATVDDTWSLSDLESFCSEDAPPVAVTIYQSDSSYFANGSTDDFEENERLFEDVAADTYYVDLAIPDGYSAMQVRCQSDPMMGTIPIDNDSLAMAGGVQLLNGQTVEVHAGEQASCYAYLVPEASVEAAGQISVHVAGCTNESGVPLNASLADLQALCEEEVPPTLVSIFFGGDPAFQASTGDFGETLMEEAVPGVYAVFLDLPAGFTESQTYCRQEAIYDVDGTSDVVDVDPNPPPGPEIEVAPGQKATCYAFLFP